MEAAGEEQAATVVDPILVVDLADGNETSYTATHDTDVSKAFSTLEALQRTRVDGAENDALEDPQALFDALE